MSQVRACADSLADAMELSQAQNVVEALAPRDYYKTTYRQHESDYLPKLVELVSDLRPVGFPRSSLEVGPGWGTMVVYLAASNWDVSTLDNQPVGQYIDPALLELTRAKYHYRDVFDKPLQQEFDLILCTQVLLHLKHRPDTAIEHISSMLSPTGTAIFSVLRSERYEHVPTPMGLNGWRKLPRIGSQEEVPPESVTFHLDENGFSELLWTGFEHVRIWRPEGTTVQFGICRRKA